MKYIVQKDKYYCVLNLSLNNESITMDTSCGNYHHMCNNLKPQTVPLINDILSFFIQPKIDRKTIFTRGISCRNALNWFEIVSYSDCIKL